MATDSHISCILPQGKNTQTFRFRPYFKEEKIKLHTINRNSQSLIGIRFNPFNVFQGKTHWFKDAKEPSQVSPTHNYLIFNIFKWIFMHSWRFTRFHTLSLECVKLVNLYEGIQASRIVSKYQALTNMWDLWRQYQQLFFGCRERTKNALTNVFICQEQFSKDEELFEKALHLLKIVLG